jgi:sulfopyruvate decarboxylase TPP-binding subunit
VETLITVPDISTSEGLLRPISADPELRHVTVCKEDEGIGISAALSYCDKRALMLIQNTGLLDSVNALRVVGVEYGLPICLMVGLLGNDPDIPPREANNYAVRIIQPILDAMGVEHHLLLSDADIGLIGPAIDTAYGASRPVVILIGRRPEPS